MEDANELIVRDTAPGQAWPQVNLRFVVFFYNLWDGDLPCTAEQILAFLFHLLEDLKSRKRGLQFLSAESNPFKLGMSAFIEKCGKVRAAWNAWQVSEKRGGRKMGAKPPVVITMAPKLETVGGSSENSAQERGLTLMFTQLSKLTALMSTIIT